MRFFISFFGVLMLMLTLTPLASAGFTVANDSDVKIEVIYGYWDGDQNLFRIRGYYHIPPNESKSLWTPAGVSEVFARIWQSQSNNVVEHDRESYQSSRVHPRLAFDVFYKQDGTIVKSDVPNNELVTRSDFYKYANNTTFRYQPGNGAVTIPDPNLRAAIEEALGKVSTITQADMLTLTELDVSSRSIQDLTGIEFATNLTRLDFGGNEVSDVSALASLRNLMELDLYHNQVSDVSALASLRNLTRLALGFNQVSDVSALRGLTNLTELYLSGNQVSDVSALASLRNLEVLNFGGNEVSDVSALASLRNLEVLNFDGNDVSDVSALRGLTNLTKLELSGNQVSDVSALASLTKLTWLMLGDNEVSDVSPLASLRNLPRLWLWGNEVSDVSPLASLRNLVWLFLSGNDVSDVSALASLTKLRRLMLGDNEVSDVSALASLTNLRWLYLDDNEVSDVSALASLTNLTELYLSGNQISDFSPIAGLIPNLREYSNRDQRVPNTTINIPDPNLRAAIEAKLGKASGAMLTQADMWTLTRLDVSSRSIQDLTGIEFATNLTELWLSGNHIWDISLLGGLTKLTELSLRDNDVSDVSALASLTNLRWLYLHENQISDFSPIAGLIPNLRGYRNENQRVVDPNTAVNIPDPNLRAAIEEALRKASGTTITAADMLTLTELSAKRQPIQDLTGIEFATNLTELWLSGNDVSDVSVLGGLTKLKHLALANNDVSDVSPLGGLTNLISLYLSGNDVSDVSVLGGLRNLSYLYLSGNDVSDVSPLGGLTNLTALSLGENQVSDVSVLGGLTKLTELDLSNNQVSDVSALGGLTKLKHLALANNEVSDVSPLGGLTNLIRLDLSGNEVSDVSVLGGLTNLRELYLGDNDVSDVSVLGGLTRLELLYLSGNQISDFSPIAGLIPNLTRYLNENQYPNTAINIPDPNLRAAIEAKLGKASGATIIRADMRTLTSLDVSSRSIQDLTGIEFATNLGSLYLGDNDVSDVSVLGGLTNLGSLYLEDNDVSDVSVLGGLTNLIRLDLEENQISDVSGLASLTKLRRLDLHDNQISDISALAGLTKLTELYLSGNDVSDISALAGLTKLIRLDLSGNDVSDISALAGLTRLGWLYLHDNQISDISALAGFTLGTLYLHDNQISDISALRGTKLRELNLSGNRISDISALGGLRNLRELYLSNNSIVNFSPIAGLAKNLMIYSPSFLKFPEYFPGICSADMPDPSYHLVRTRTEPVTEKRQVASEGNITVDATVATTSSIIAKDPGEAGRRLTWTVEDTVIGKSKGAYTGALILTVKFINGSSAHKERVKRVANEWCKYGNVRFKYVNSGPSDIRIAFDYEKDNKGQVIKKNWFSNVGVNTVSESVRPYTMHFSTDYSDGTVLHEFGHALGLVHEHLSPQFNSLFRWVPEHKEDRSGAEPGLYSTIKSAYAFSKQLTEAQIKQKINDNFLNFREDEVHEDSTFDPDSVMTYVIGPAFLEARPNAPDWAKRLVDEDHPIYQNDTEPWYPLGIGDNEKLSDGDKAFIRDIYGPPVPLARVSGTVSMEGEDDETGKLDWSKCATKVWFFGEEVCLPGLVQIPDDDHEDSVSISRLVVSNKGYTVAPKPVAEFKWGGEIRVEVYLGSREIKDGYVHMAAFALLYEGTEDTTTDLEDIECKDFKIPLGGSKKVELHVENEWAKYFDLSIDVRKCKGVVLNFRESGLRGDILGGGDWADVTLDLKAESIKPEDVDPSTDVLAAPSLVVVHSTSFSETAESISVSDVNGDGQVNVTDLVLVSHYIGRTAPVNLPVDVNGDGAVTIADLVQVAQYLGQSTISSAPVSVVVPNGLTYETVEAWIHQARLEDDGSRGFNQGIVNLEYLLTLIVPEKTALLHNYPNPFNPETWIPYHLAEPAHVVLTIYTVDGKVVRRLDLGHQGAGYYQSKSRAAYWDGRNAVGERVASGVYFYTLTAGDFAATQKMLILK